MQFKPLGYSYFSSKEILLHSIYKYQTKGKTNLILLSRPFRENTFNFASSQELHEFEKQLKSHTFPKINLRETYCFMDANIPTVCSSSFLSSYLFIFLFIFFSSFFSSLLSPSLPFLSFFNFLEPLFYFISLTF